jgi:DNA polymerase-3 subunit epsilon
MRDRWYEHGSELSPGFGAVALINRGTFPKRLRWQPGWGIDEAPLLFVDLETTGLYPERGHQIIEAAIFDAGGLRYHSGQPLSGAALDDDERAMVREVVQIVEHKVVIGHNIPFDLGFIAERCRRLGFAPPAVGFVDTLGMARRFIEDPDEELTLEYVARCLGLDIPTQLHRAVPDARLARDLFRTMCDRQGLETLEDVRVRQYLVHDH